VRPRGGIGAAHRRRRATTDFSTRRRFSVRAEDRLGEIAMPNKNEQRDDELQHKDPQPELGDEEERDEARVGQVANDDLEDDEMEDEDDEEDIEEPEIADERDDVSRR
jgi:hypothetical protein